MQRQRRRKSTGTKGSLGGAHGERVEREPITGVWGQSPQRGPGAELDLKALNDAVHLTASLCYVYQVVYTFVRLC